MCEWTALRQSRHTFASDELSVLMLIAGSGTISWGEQERRSVMVGAGDTVLLPAGLPSVEFSADDDVTLLDVTPSRNDS